MRRAAFTAAALAAAAATAPAASAATLAVDHGCYLASQPGLANGQRVNVHGEGFAPNAPVMFSLGGASFGTATADVAGAVDAFFNSPKLPRGQFRAARTLQAGDGVNRATTMVELRNLAADFLPSSGNPRTLKVRFFVYGFGPLLAALNRAPSQDVWMHTFEPSGRRRSSVKVGRTSGACGDLTTSKRRILTFRPKNGTWHFRFTTSRRYSRRAVPAASVGFTVKTVFRRA